MALIKGQLKLKNAEGLFDIIMPQTEAALVKLANGENLEVQVMKNIDDIAAAQQAADNAQAAADAAQQQADKGVADAAAAKAIADQAVLDAAAAQAQADKGVADAAAAQQAADNAQAAADAAQADATQALADAAAEKLRAEGQEAAIREELANEKAALQDDLAALKTELQGEIDADVAAEALLRENADKALDERVKPLETHVAAQPAVDAEQDRRLGVLEAAVGEGGDTKKAIDAAQAAADAAQAAADAAQAAADNAQAAADAAQAQADKGVADAAAAKAIADQAVLDAAAAQQQADKGVADAAAAQQAADKANADLLAIQNGKNKANGFVELDAEGLIPAAFIPNEFKEIKVVANVSERDAIADKFSGLAVYVKDATGDNTVARGGAYYIYDGGAWLKTAESESLDVVLNWAAIEDKPTTIAGYGITDAVNVSEIVAAPAANKVLRLNGDGKLPADVTGNAATASKFAAKVNIGINGDDVVAAVQEFDGSQAINIPVVLSNTGVAAGTYTKVQVDAKGRVVAAQNLVAADIPELDWAKITSGKPTTLEGYGIVDGVNKAGDTMTGHLVLHANPVEDMHAATKAYVDSMVQGLDVKESVRVATVANINLNGLQAIDGVNVNAGDRVLVKDQDNAAENGIYIAGTAAWVRANDAINGKVGPGMFTFVEEGSTNNNNGYVLANDGAINVGSTELNFAQFSGMGQILVGNGLGKNGNTIYLTDTGVAAGTYTKVQVDAQGRVVAAQNLAPEDLPEVAWAVITGKPNSAVADIDDAVAKRHAHANAAQLDKIGEADGVMTYDGNKMATQQFAQDYAESMIALSATEPQNMPVNGLWIQVVE